MAQNIDKILAESKKKKEEGTLSVSNTSNIDRILNQSKLKATINFDTFSNDLNTIGTMVNNIYNGWQNSDTMTAAKSSVKKMYNRLNAYKKYSKTYGDNSIDVTQTINAYKTILDEWDTLAEKYAEYDTADDYNKAYQKAKIDAKLLAEKRNRNLEDYQSEIDDLETKLKKAEEYEFKVALTRNKYQHYGENGYDEIKKAHEEYKNYLTSIGYSSSNELNKKIKNLKADKKEAWRYQTLQNYSSVADETSENYDAEFEKYAQIGENIKNPTYNEAQPKVIFWGHPFGGKEVGNIVTFSRENSDENGIKHDYLDNKGNVGNYYYVLMTDDETKLYNYYLARDKQNGTDKASEYLKWLQQDLINRRGANIADSLKGKKLLEFLYSVNAGVDQFGQGVKNAFNTKDDYIPYSHTQVASSIVREDLADVGPKILDSSLGQMGYDFVKNITNMAPSILASVAADAVLPGSGSYVGSTLMGLSAAGNAYQQALNSGMDKWSSKTYAALVGVSEAGLSATFSKVFGGKALEKSVQTAINGIDNGLARFAANFGYAAVSEGFEEAAQEVLDPLFENIALGYNKNGFEDINWSEVAYSGLLGAMSGGFFETLNGNTIEFTNNEKKIIDFVVNQRITQLEQTGETVTSEKKNNIEKQVKIDLTRGDISTDVIEEVLDADNYYAYKKALNIETALRQTYDKQGNKQDVILFENSEINNLKNKVTDNIFKLIEKDNKKLKGRESYLAESYNEKLRRRQAFEDSYQESIIAQKNSADEGDVVVQQGVQNAASTEIGAIRNNTDRAATGVVKGTDGRQYFDEDSTDEYFGNIGGAEEKASHLTTSYGGATAQGEAAVSGGNLLDLELSEPAIADITRPYTFEESIAAAISGEQLDTKQRRILDFAKQHFPNINVKFSGNMTKNALWDSDSKTLLLNINQTVSGMYTEVFKHEFMHTLESKRLYQEFKQFLFNKDTAFGIWVKVQCKIHGIELSQNATAKEAINALCEYYYTTVKNDVNIAKKYRDAFTIDGAQSEMVADFFGEIMFNGKKYRTQTAQALADETFLTLFDENEISDFETSSMEALAEISEYKPNIFRQIVDWVNRLILKLRGTQIKADTILADELERNIKTLEDYVKQVYNSREIKKSAQNNGIEFKTSLQNNYDYSKSFAQQIDDYKSGKIPNGDTLLVGATPELFQSIGFNALPMTINITHVDYALEGTKDTDHHLGETMLKQLPKSIKDPVAIFISQTKENSSVVALLNFKVNGKQTVAPIVIDGFGFQNNIRIDSNAITSVYGKGSAINQLYKAAQDEANGKFSLLYVNKKEADSLLQSAGHQLSGGLIPRDGFYHSIRENGSPVKSRFNDVTETQQFKRWFGDWQKHQNTASKVVDKFGKPLVMYHGTDANFTEFNTDNKSTSGKLNFGKGIYLTPNKSLAEMYTTIGNVMSLYVAVKNPYEIFSTRLYDFDLKRLSVEFGESVTVDNIDKILQKNGYDGIILRDYNGTINQVIVFNSNQVKSATDNIGTFDANNGNINFAITSQMQQLRYNQEAYDERLMSRQAFEDAYRESAMEQKNTDENSDIKYSIIKTSKMPYLEQLQLIEKRQINGSNSLYIGKPSQQLQKVGLSNAPFAMNQSDYRKSRRKFGNNKNYSSHAVPYEFFENMPQYFADAPLLIDNGEKVSVITSYPMNDTKGQASYIIGGVWQNQQMENDTVNLVKSVYPLDDFVSQIAKAAETGSLVIINKNKAEQMLATIGIQPSKVSHIVSLSKHTISQKAQSVNTGISENGPAYSDSFINRDTYKKAAENGRVVYKSISNDKITLNMDESARADIIRKTRLNVVEFTDEGAELSSKEVIKLKNTYKSNAQEILKQLCEKFDVFKNYNNEDIEINFNYSRASLRESVHKENERGANFYDFAKMLYVFDDVVANAQAIETHTDKYVETKRANRNLKQVYILMSALKDGEYIIPVEFNVKEFVDGTKNQLYISVTLHKMKADLMAAPSEQSSYRTAKSTLSYSLYDIIKNVNPADKEFLKYIPDELLSKEQQTSKNIALSQEKETLLYDNPKPHKWFGNIEESVPEESIPNPNENVKENSVNNSDRDYLQSAYGYDETEKENITYEGDVKFMARENLESYIETQYNNFGWVRYNDVLSAKEYSALLSRYADYKHNKDNYPTTRFGEAVIFSFDYPNILMYVKGATESPEITKIFKTKDSLSLEMQSEIQEEILHNERRHLPFPYETIINFYGEEVFSILKARNYETFWRIKSRAKGESGKRSNTVSEIEQNGTRGIITSKTTDKSELIKNSDRDYLQSAYGYDETEKENITYEGDVKFMARENLESYIETQYNNFGWVRYNDVLSAKEYSALLSRYADYKHNKDHYPTTRFGEAVIYSFDYPNILMYVKGAIESPQITKILKIDSSIPDTIQTDIQKEISSNERNNLSLPWENVTSVFGEESIDINKKRDFLSFQEYKRRSKREFSGEDNPYHRDKQNGTRGIITSKTTDKSELIKNSDRDYLQSAYGYDKTEKVSTADEGDLAVQQGGATAQGEAAVSGGNLLDLELSEPAIADITRPYTFEESIAAAISGEQLDTKQRRILDFAKQHFPNINVKFSGNMTKNALWDSDSKTLLLNINQTVSGMYTEVFKHEFMHTLESKRLYQEFKQFLFNKDTAFGIWVKVQCKIHGIELSQNATAKEAINALCEYYYTTVKNDVNIAKKYRDAFTIDGAQSEMVADFFGEIMFNGKKYRAQTAQALADETFLTLFDQNAIAEFEANSMAALAEISEYKLNIFKQIVDWVKQIILKLRGTRIRADRLLADELERNIKTLEDYVKQVYNSREIKKTAENGGVEYKSISNNKITPNMDESERADIIRNTTIDVVEFKDDKAELSGKEVLKLKSTYKSKAQKILKPLAEKFGVFKDYSNDDIKLEFNYSRNSLEESIHKENERSANFYDFAKMLYVFDDVVANAQAIETHTDKYVETKRENRNLKQVYVLMSAFKDGDFIIPVEFNIKEFVDEVKNQLYVSVTLQKMKADLMGTSSEQSSYHIPKSTFNYSLPDIIKNVNPADKEFLKYIPDELLSKEQKTSKNIALSQEKERLYDMRYDYAVKNNLNRAKEMLDERRKEKGYEQNFDWRIEHKAPNSQDESAHSIDKLDKVYGSDIYSPQAVYYYGEGRKYDQKAVEVIQKAHNKPNDMIKIYRAVPTNIKDTRVRNGDWVAVTKEYADEYGYRWLDGDYKIIENTVLAKHLFNNGDSIQEFGYDNGDINEVYKNAEGNVKLNDITYDDNGNVIPLSKRFDENNRDIRFAVTSQMQQLRYNREAYDERLRSRQAFEVDLSQIEEKYRDTYKKAEESGVLNDTKRTHELVDMIAKISADKGVRFDFVNNEKISKSGFAADDKIVNGYLDEKGNIVINIDSSKALESTVGHEITHILEGTELYAKLETAITEYAIQKGEYDNRLAALTELYKNVEGADVSKELVADLVGDYLFSDSEFIRRLSTEHRNIFEKIFDEIKYMLRIVTAGSKEARRLEKVKKAFENAYRESGKVQKNTAADGGVKYGFAGDVVSYSIGFSEENNTSETQQILSLINNSMEKISDEQVFEVAYDNIIENFSKKTDYVMEVFNEQGNIAYNSVIGNVELSKSGAKSTIMHGFGREKLAAIKAIKPVIENGDVISKVTNYNNTDVDRYIVAAKGVINGEKAIVGVVVKSYPSKVGNSKFYLHEAEIIKTGSPVMTAPQLSVDTVSKSAFDSTVPQKAQSVNTSISENFENDTKNILPVKNSISNKKAIESGISNNTISASDTDIRYSDRDSFTYKEYNRLIYKKPIKVSKQDWVNVNSRRTQKYAHISDENVPVLDLIKLAEYNRINEAYGYVIRNIDKYSFSIISKRKVISEKSQVLNERKEIYDSIDRQNVGNGNRDGFDRRSSESPRYGGTIRENASEIRQPSESEYDNHFGYGASDSRRGIGLSTQGHLQAVDNDNETQQNNTDVNKRFSVSADENRSDITPETSPAYSGSFINRESDSVDNTINKFTDEKIDFANDLQYNNKRGENYARTDEFRRLQAESQRMSDEDSQLYHSGERRIDNEVRRRLSGAFRLELRSTNSKRIYSIRTLLNPKTNNNVNIIEGVDGSLFRDIFEISRKYLKNGELVDLHEIETTNYGIGYNDCYNCLSEDGLSGFSITPDGDLISVFNLSAEKGFLKTIAPIVMEKAKTLDCYASPKQNLMTMYEKIFGFKTASIMDYNMEYDHDNIAENHDMPKVAFMVNTDSDVKTRYFTETQYEEAVTYRNRFVNKATADSAFFNYKKSKEIDNMSFINAMWGRDDHIDGNIYKIIERLNNGEDVSIEEINTDHTIAQLLADAFSRAETYTNNTPKRIAKRKEIIYKLLALGSATVDSNGKVRYNGIIKQDRRADIVIGLSAAGKSSVLVDPLSQYYSSRIIDSDMAKEELPEFDNGRGANAVHKESQNIIKEVLAQSVFNGDNIVYPIVGGNDVNSLINKINNLKNEGYSVYLHLNELPNSKAIGRSLNRYIETGRFIPPEIIKQYGNTPTQNFNTIISIGGLVDGYSHYSNDVERGQSPKLIKVSENVRQFDERGHSVSKSTREGQSNQKAKAAETNEIAYINEASSTDGVFFDDKNTQSYLFEQGETVKKQSGLTYDENVKLGIAPRRETISENKVIEDIATYNASNTEEEANAQSAENLSILTDSEEPIINKLTGKKISKETYEILKKLEYGEAVTLDEIVSLPEIVEAKEKVLEITDKFIADNPNFKDVPIKYVGTHLIDTAERVQLINNILKERLESGSFTSLDSNGNEVYNGSVKRGKRIDIVIGLPAAGKSTATVNPLSQYYKSVVVDSDIIKGKLPEFNKGWGATLVHEESSAINMRMLREELLLGNNIILPIVGAKISSVENYINSAKEAGYEVHLHLNELNSSKTMGRMLRRYFKDGRFIPPEISFKNGDKPTKVYEELKNRGDLNGYSRWNNDVAKGQRPTLTEVSGNNRAYAEYSNSWRAVRGTDAYGNDRGIQSGETQTNEIAYINEASSTDGVFFDEKNNNTKNSLYEAGHDYAAAFSVPRDNKNSVYKEYSYENLVNKPDMVLTVLGDNVPDNRADIVADAKKNAAAVGKVNDDGSISVYVNDIKSDVILATKGLRHGLRRTRALQDSVNVKVTLKAVEILKNSIRINDLIPTKENAYGSYVLIGAAKDIVGNLYIVQSVVNSFDNDLISMDVLYAINAKKEELAATKSPRFAAEPLSVTSSTISISNLLDHVNKYFPDILPESVLKHYGYTSRPDGKLGESALFSVSRYNKNGVYNEYSYENLVNKPDMVLTVLGDNVPDNRADIVADAKKNAAAVGKVNDDGSISVYVNDIKKYVIIGKRGLVHGLDRRFSENAAVTLYAGDIIKNSIKINELTPAKQEVTESYVLIGAAIDQNETLNIVRFIVNKFNNELIDIEVLYAINTKKESTAVLNAPLDSIPDYRTTISISNLLDYVNKYFPDILPESVLKHYGYTSRPDGKLGESALFSVAKDITSENDITKNRIYENEYDFNEKTFKDYDSFEKESLNSKDYDYIKSVCNNLGRQVVFEDLREYYLKGYIISPDGYIDKDGVIHLNIYSKNAISFVLKHELTHFGENAEKGYADFVDAVQNSSMYYDWLVEKTGVEYWWDALDKYKQDVLDSDPSIHSIDDPKIMREIIADFAGDMLFTQDGSGITAIASNLEAKHRNKFIQFILDFISFIKKKLNGNSFMNLQLSVLEDGFNRMISEASNKSTSKVDLSDINKISYCFVRCTDNERIDAAEKMRAKGYDIVSIWREYGIIKDPLGNWLDELDIRQYYFYVNGNAKIANHGPNPNIKEVNGVIKSRLKNFVKWRELFERFPELEKAEVVIQYATVPESRNTVVYLADVNRFIIDKYLYDDCLNNNDPLIKTVLIEQIQRAIQFLEGRRMPRNINLLYEMEQKGKLPFSERYQRNLTSKEVLDSMYDEKEAKKVGERQFLRSNLVHYNKKVEDLPSLKLYEPYFNTDETFVFNDKGKLSTLKKYDASKRQHYYVPQIKPNDVLDAQENTDTPTSAEYDRLVKASQKEMLEKGENTRRMKSYLLSKIPKKISKKGEKRARANNKIRAGNEGFLTYCNSAEEGRYTINQRFSNDVLNKPLINRDTAGRILDDSMLSRLEGTGLKNQKGEPLSLFFRSYNGHDGFNQSHLGLVLRTEKACIKECASFKDMNPNARNLTLTEAYAVLKNPLFLPYDLYNGAIYDVIFRLVNEDVITLEECRKIINTKYAKEDLHYNSTVIKKLRDKLKSLNYDSIIFIDETVDPGSMAAIVFDREQVIPVARNGVLIENNGVRENVPRSENEVEKVVVENGESSQKVGYFLRDVLFNRRNKWLLPDNKIKAGNSGCFDQNWSDIDEAKTQLNKIFLKNAETEPSGYDTVNRELSKNEKAECERSVLKDDIGNRLSLYQSTLSSVNISKQIDDGLYLKTFNDAVDDFISRKIKNPATHNGIITEYELNIINPLIVQSETGLWNTLEIANQLFEAKKISQQDYNKLISMKAVNKNTYNNLAANYLRERIKLSGFDSMVLLSKKDNRVIFSVIPFYENQVVRIAENGVLKNDSIITPQIEADYNSNYNSVTINPERVAKINVEEFRKKILNATNNTQKLQNLTEALMYSKQPVVKGIQNIIAGNTGWLERTTADVRLAFERFNAYVNGDKLKMPLSATDTAGRIVSAEVLNKFSDTVFKNEKGELLSLYIYNRFGENKIKHSQLGIHLSTIVAEHDKYLNEKQSRPNLANVVYEEAYVNFKNPYFMKTDSNNWTPKLIATQLYEEGIISRIEYKNINLIRSINSTSYNSPAVKNLKKLMRKKGFDSIVYMNEYADPGSMAVIAFDDSQIEIVAQHSITQDGEYINRADSKTEPVFYIPENEDENFVEKSRKDIIDTDADIDYNEDEIITDGSHLVDGKLKPNIIYRTGEYDYIYFTDALGRICKAFTINLQLTKRKNRRKNNPNTLGKIIADHAGHLFGDRFGGSPDIDNEVSQSKLVNLSEYKKIENKWAKALKQGKNVRVSIDVQYEGDSMRPSGFVINYFIDGVKDTANIKN